MQFLISLLFFFVLDSSHPFVVPLPPFRPGNRPFTARNQPTIQSTKCHTTNNFFEEKNNTDKTGGLRHHAGASFLVRWPGRRRHPRTKIKRKAGLAATKRKKPKSFYFVIIGISFFSSSWHVLTVLTREVTPWRLLTLLCLFPLPATQPRSPPLSLSLVKKVSRPNPSPMRMHIYFPCRGVWVAG